MWYAEKGDRGKRRTFIRNFWGWRRLTWNVKESNGEKKCTLCVILIKNG